MMLCRSGVLDRLCRPYSGQEPNVPADELAILDALADQVEISRLKRFGSSSPNFFSTSRQGQAPYYSICENLAGQVHVQ